MTPLLTEEQFQDLCHDLNPEDANRFRNGCRLYWKKLGFGDMRFVVKGIAIWELTEEMYSKWVSEGKPSDLSSFGIRIGIIADTIL